MKINLYPFFAFSGGPAEGLDLSDIEITIRKVSRADASSVKLVDAVPAQAEVGKGYYAYAFEAEELDDYDYMTFIKYVGSEPVSPSFYSSDILDMCISNYIRSQYAVANLQARLYPFFAYSSGPADDLTLSDIEVTVLRIDRDNPTGYVAVVDAEAAQANIGDGYYAYFAVLTDLDRYDYLPVLKYVGTKAVTPSFYASDRILDMTVSELLDPDIAGTSLRTIRQRVAQDLGSLFVGVTSADGAADGSTLVDADLVDFIKDEVKNQFVLVTSGAVSGEQRKVGTHENSTLMPRKVFSAKVPVNTSYEVHNIDPAIIKTKVKAMIRAAFPTLCRVLVDETIITVADQHTYDLPVNFEGDAWNISIYDADGLHPAQLCDWGFNETEHSITFDYDLPAERILRLAGVGYLSQVESDDDLVEVITPRVEYLYTLVKLELCRILAAQEMGTGSERYQAEVKRLEELEKVQKKQHFMALPQRTMKEPGWRYTSG